MAGMGVTGGVGAHQKRSGAAPGRAGRRQSVPSTDMSTQDSSAQKGGAQTTAQPVRCMDCDRTWPHGERYLADNRAWASDQGGDVGLLARARLKRDLRDGVLRADGFHVLTRCPRCTVERARDGQVVRDVRNYYQRLKAQEGNDGD